MRLPVWLVALLLLGSRLPAAERYRAQFRDGSRIVGEEVRDWYDTKAEPKLADRKLFDAKNPVRWVLDTTQLPSSAPLQYVEHIGGDRLPCRVLAYASGAENPYDRQPPHLVVEPTISVQWPDPRQRKPVRVLSRWLRRVVWESRGSERYQPGTLFHRDGRQLTFRALRWQTDSVRLLLADGSSEIPFSQIGELHLPRQDLWEAYCEQVALVSPECSSRLMRVEGEDGLRITTSLERLQARNNGSHPDHWYHAVQPAWALEPLWLRHRAIRMRSFFEPREMPLSIWDPAEVRQRYLLAGAWNWQRDRNAQSGPLRSGGEDFGWGLGTHAQCGLTFELPPLARRFSCRVGLDELVGSGGCARAVVRLGGTDNTPVFQSPLMIGAEQVIEIGAIDLPAVEPSADKPRGHMLTLLADAAYEDRPKGADPLDIRDVVDWLEPLVELDADGLREEVARRAVDLVPAWRDWDLSEVETGPATIQNIWDDTDQRNLRYVTLVRARHKLLSLEQSVEVTPESRALLLCVGRLPNQTSAAKLLVEVDGRPLGTFEVPERRGIADPDPIFVPLDAYLGREVKLRITQSPLGPQSLVEWRSATLVSHWPGLLPVFEDQADYPERVSDSATLAIDNEQVFSGGASLHVLPAEGPDPHRAEIMLKIRESPRLGEYRYVRFAWKVRGEGPVCCSIGRDGLWGPNVELREGRKGAQHSFRYDAGKGEPSYGAALRVDRQPPAEWAVVTRDLYADFGEFTLTGLAFSVPAGQEAWLDHVYFARTTGDFSRIEAKPKK